MNLERNAMAVFIYLICVSLVMIIFCQWSFNWLFLRYNRCFCLHSIKLLTMKIAALFRLGCDDYLQNLNFVKLRQIAHGSKDAAKNNFFYLPTTSYVFSLRSMATFHISLYYRFSKHRRGQLPCSHPREPSTLRGGLGQARGRGRLCPGPGGRSGHLC